MHFSGLHTCSNRAFDLICLWVLPIGYLSLLAALFLLPERSLHQKLFYATFSIPALLALCLRPAEFLKLLKEPIVIGFLLFAGWALLSLAWGGGDEAGWKLSKRPLHTLMLFFGCYLLLRHRSESLQPVLLGAALVALGTSLYSLIGFVAGDYHPGDRLIGSGALDNPLLSSHLFGFFCVYWLSLSLTTRRPHLLWLSIPALVVMFAAVVATGSRTPLVALSLAALWLSFICWHRGSPLLIAALLLTGTVFLLLFPELIMTRGDSYRRDLWQLTLGKIAEHPWIGHGYSANLSLDPGTGYALREPHNFALGVLYYVGILGLLPWLFVQAWALLASWRQRAQPLFILASTWLVFGIGAGLTEGGGILSRPKEHWFLLWIPLALIAALCIANRHRRLLNYPVTELSVAAAEQLCAHALVIEADGLGPKVLRLSDGSFFKLFRRRRWFSSGSFNPYAERFALNSEHLRALAIATPQVLGLYRLKDGSTAVRYQPLPGQTLRQTLQALPGPAERQALVRRFGEFLGTLHDRGVYFRSLHLGNVLIMANHEFGLIDLADMRILPSPLSRALRQRNLHHMRRYPQERIWLFQEHAEALLSGYAEQASRRATEHLRTQIRRLGNDVEAAAP
ncbi:MAG: O-antigen ligase family protein [Pseudomonas sp.]|uniref:O-antigen ligase family protein n=1 Tax=Pseudomonas sp. TaxID=306 RepID=UPI0033931CA8